MGAAALKHFDVLEYVDHVTALGVSEQVAKYQARKFEQVVELAVNTSKEEVENKELATKQDVRILENRISIIEQNIGSKIDAVINKSKYELLAWMVGLFVTSGVLQYVLK